jgi:hypothetical protein
MPAIKITNPKISTELVEELQDEPAYANEKAFSATHAFLRRVLHFCRDHEYAYIPAKNIKEQFDNYGIKYKRCLDVLSRHEIIKINRMYIVGTKTRGYRLTEKGARLLTEGELVYLRSLFTDSKLKRQMQKRASYYRSKDKTYKNDFLQYIHDGRMRYQYNEDAVNFIKQSDWPYLTRLDALMSLTDFTERDFTDLKFNESDGRVWNEFVGMKSDLRRYFSNGDLHYRFVMDIRSCHPLFLAHYLVNRARVKGWQTHHPLLPGDHQHTIVQNDLARGREQSERLSFPNTTTTTTTTTTPFPPISSNPTYTTSNNNPLSHYDGGNSDILAELNRWNTIFSDPNTDPKTILIRELGYNRAQAKAALNQSINGGKKYRKFMTWFKKNFPMLYGVWVRTESATVGNDISNFYETELMQDFALYELAMKLGLHLTYEYDGCGVMCREDDREVLAKIQQLIAHVQAHSERLWGIRPVIVVKTAAGAPVSMTTEATGITERRNITQRQPASIPATHTAASESRRSSSRSAHPGRKHRG